MVTAPLPHPKLVRDMLADLLGRDVDIAPGEPVLPTQDTRASVGVYVAGSLTTAAAICADLNLTAFAGASLGLIPPATAEAAIEEGVVPANIWENFAEVLNICASLLNRDDSGHVKLYNSYAPDQLPPNDISQLLRGFGGRLDLEVSVAGYGKGALSLVRVL
ncbi:MAG: hypothetical protein WC005_05920 [Candidatus Nanopelagicales bacterium]